MAEINIPNSVAEIGTGAFYCCESLPNITLPDKMKSISPFSFYGCKSLNSISIPNGVETIGNGAFIGCPLETVYIPQSVTVIGTGGEIDELATETGSFACSPLKAINVDENNPVYKSVDGVLFNKSGEVLLQYPKGRNTNYTIPSGTQEIGDFAFCETRASHIAFPEGLSKIGAAAFENSKTLTEIIIPDGLDNIGDFSFYGCAILTNVSLPSSVQSIGYRAFDFCNALKAADGSIKYRGTRTEWDQIDIRDKNDALSNVTFVNAIPAVDVGDTIMFGCYEQDGDQSNGKESLEWLVLNTSDQYVMLITKYAIDTKPYNEVAGNITWEGCSIREWLNNDFLLAAFDEDERNAIVTVSVKNDNSQINAYWPSRGGNDTTDKVFLLSYHEAETLFSDSYARYCVPTAYALSTGTWLSEEGMCHWWLRSPGETQGDAAYCSYEGNLFSGTWCNNIAISVRPVIWASLQSNCV